MELSSAAQASALIRKELKSRLPKSKFKVSTSRYSGGSTIYVSWTDGYTEDQVKDITCKYVYGKFDGTTDSYDYSNSRSDIPQVTFIFTERSISEVERSNMIKKIEERFAVDMADQNSIMAKFNMWPDQLLWSELKDIDFNKEGN
jgi:hypothetical protein